MNNIIQHIYFPYALSMLNEWFKSYEKYKKIMRFFIFFCYEFKSLMSEKLVRPKELLPPSELFMSFLWKQSFLCNVSDDS